MNSSYSFLLTKLMKINSMADLNAQADSLCYFLADSYVGSKEISNDVGQFA